ncbi:MAG: DUF885 family protein [Acidobacteria bacterium]|nr:DUF885 family protein [Acidobacteriota bacterium]
MLMRSLALFLLLAPLAMAQSQQAALHQLFEDYYEDLMRFSPEQATSVGRTDYDDRWSDFSPSGRKAWRDAQRSFVGRLQAIPEAGLGEQDRLSRSLLLTDLQQSLDGAELEDYLLSFNQLFGLHTSVLLTINEMPTRTVRDFENRIARVRATPAYVDGVISVLQDGVKAGIVQPAYIAQTIAGQIESQAAPPAAESPLLEAFRSYPDEIPVAERARLSEQAEAAYANAFQPAWRKLHDFVADVYVPAGRKNIAATSLPNGQALYAHLVKRYTTTDRTPEQIHQMGLDEVARIKAEIESIATEAGYPNGEVFEAYLQHTPDQRFASKEEMLVYCRNLAKIIDPGLPRFFLKLPRMPFGIRPIPEDREAASASNYSAPASDGSRAGFFNLKAYKPEEQWKFSMHSLILHETNPGHHLQIATQIEIEGLPEFRKIYHVGAYIEGWALYAESLGDALGVYPDAASKFSKLESERFRAKRLVVDTGLHAKGWTREQAIAYMGEEYTSEVDRYIAWPGQALSYKMGQLRILELRREAEKALGEKFDIREFHDVVLRNGPLPLDLLSKEVHTWVASK